MKLIHAILITVLCASASCVSKSPLGVTPEAATREPVVKTLSTQGATEVQLASGKELQRLFEIAMDVVSGELDRELRSRAGKDLPDRNGKFGQNIRFIRSKEKHNLPSVMIGNKLLRQHLLLSGEAKTLRETATRSPSLAGVAAQKTKKLERFWNYLQRHGAYAGGFKRCVGLTLEGEIIDIVRAPGIIEDPNVDIELKLYLHWKVTDGKLTFTVDDIAGDDLWVGSDHLGAVILGWGSRSVPVDLAKNQAWTYAGTSIQSSIDRIISELRLKNSLPNDASIRIEDIYLKGGGGLMWPAPPNLMAKVSWTLP